MRTMATSPRNRRALMEPSPPAFVVELRRRLDLAVLRNEAVVTAEHAYTGWEAGHETVNGWSTKIARRAEPGKIIEVWYDALDEDVCIYGAAEYRERKWNQVMTQRLVAACTNLTSSLMPSPIIS